MENLKIQYGRNYYRKFGISPFKQNYGQEIGDAQVIINSIINNIEIPDDNVQFKAMAVTRFCHLHILSYSKQELYKACTYVIKRSACCSLCTVHFQSTQKHVNRALKKAGLDVSSSSNLVPTFHVIMANPSQKKSCP
ncbi:hypothetical protein ERO13_D08G083250v2 [Gossypium hirsutum]|uniref:KAT8 regulatory NSL complex subunit 2 n=4 Tax=Gossypium TaxID=3633 RepID=A0A5J5QB99_GOSBA|nr:hypothetical protein ES319_D08G086400v1 [Gossypium barbadense]KAG4133219.1 hypothetical protein ERO13_D08G083250v2 [Gossypium hirsutum]TYG56791.1 hypothetical protein ES288_D08G092000v1 [Gossypium darwinii]TYH57459.1 hypothetical protein ES332_D08G090600v1 [Gossypium tomentosum]TYI68439.1 hypothetical protein E1A91_D08G088800v1 [Gossypium mustelinum]